MDIYTTLKMERIIALNPSDINTNFKQNLLNTLRNEVEGKCNKEGYIEKGSVEITDNGNLYTEVIRYRGHVRVKVIFIGRVVNPTKDDIIECKIKRYNQFGIMAISGPLNIVIPFDDKHKNTNFNIGQSLKVRIVESELILNSNQINVCATFFDDKIDVNPKEIKSSNGNVNESSTESDKNESKKPNIDDEDDEGDDDDEVEEVDDDDDDEVDEGEGEADEDEDDADKDEDEDGEINNKPSKTGKVEGSKGGDSTKTAYLDGILPDDDDIDDSVDGSENDNTDDDGSEDNSGDDNDDDE
jgi:DNA-directed RNA polymerase subunit E'/Rpb7